MRYKLDNAGYVCAVSFGCYLDNCTEYTGAVPTGYNNLDEWATYACIQAYYIDANGNLILDYERQLELSERQAQEAIDYAPLVRKDLYENDEVLDSQYIRQVETGKVIVLENIKTIAPRVRITNIEPYEYGSLTLQTQCKNMMPCTMRAQTLSGVSFTKNYNGSVGVIGKATANIEYVISDCNFTLKANEDYYLNLGGLNCELRFNDNGEIAQQYIGASGLINLPKNTEVSQVVIKISNGQSVNTTFYPQLEYGKSFSSYVSYKCKTLNIDFSEYVRETLFPSEDLYPSDDLYPVLETTIDYILIENGCVTVSVDGIPTLLSGGAVGLFGSNSTIYANKDVTLEVEYSSSLIDVDSLEFLQGKSTTTNRFRILKDGSIEAHNGYFSGRVEADSGYFKGEINVNNRFIVDEYGNVTLPSNAVLTWEQIEGTENVANKSDIPTNTNQLENGAGYTTMSAVEAMGYQNAIQVTKITKDTVTAPFVETLGLTVGKEIKMGADATISWDNVTEQPTIPTDTNQLENGAGYTTMSAVEEKGYQNASQVTKITKDTVTTSYVNALKVKAGSVDAENITGTTIEGKTLKGISGEIGGFTIGNSAIYKSTNSISSTTSGVYIGTDGLNLGGGKAVITSAGKATLKDVEINGNGSVSFEYSSNKMALDYSGIKFGASSWNTEITKDKVQIYNTYIDKDTVHCAKYSSSVTYYTDICGDEIQLHGSTASGYFTIKSNEMIWASSSGNYIIKDNLSNPLITLSTSNVAIGASNVTIGNSSGKLSFFGSSNRAAKQSVTSITSTSTATAATVATKLNELLTALKAYNLIG